jgi:hypothetical protein
MRKCSEPDPNVGLNVGKNGSDVLVDVAERVGFVPVEPAHINNLGQFSIAQIARIAQNLSIRYKTGTAQSDFQRYPSRVEAISVADKNLGAAHPLLRSSVPLFVFTPRSGPSSQDPMTPFRPPPGRYLP